MPDDTARMKIVIWYAIWATVCAAVAGIVVSLAHTWFYHYNPTRFSRVATLVSDVELSLLLAAGQGAVVLGTGGVLARLGRGLQGTVALGLLIGIFDFAMYFLQMAVPRLELGWGPDVAILVAATVGMTLIGVQRPAASPQ